jgi:hypothetical protein
LKALAIAIFSGVILVSSSIAENINLDRPIFKAGDCFVWKPPMTATSSAVKIKKLRSVTFNGRTGHFYEIELHDRALTIETFLIDVGDVQKFKCSQYDKVKSEIESKNKLIEDAQESRNNMEREARQEAFEINVWYEQIVAEIDGIKMRCEGGVYFDQKTDRYDKHGIDDCNIGKQRRVEDLQRRWDKTIAEFRSKYPTLRISAENNSITVD